LYEGKINCENEINVLTLIFGGYPIFPILATPAEKQGKIRFL
jgi:hypothetical protein